MRVLIPCPHCDILGAVNSDEVPALPEVYLCRCERCELRFVLWLDPAGGIHASRLTAAQA